MFVWRIQRLSMLSEPTLQTADLYDRIGSATCIRLSWHLTLVVVKLEPRSIEDPCYGLRSLVPSSAAYVHIRSWPTSRVRSIRSGGSIARPPTVLSTWERARSHKLNVNYINAWNDPLAGDRGRPHFHCPPLGCPTWPVRRCSKPVLSSTVGPGFSPRVGKSIGQSSCVKGGLRRGLGHNYIEPLARLPGDQ